MFLRTFKGTGPGVIFLLIIFLILWWAQIWFITPLNNVPHTGPWSMPLYKLLLSLTSVIPSAAFILPPLFIIGMMFLTVNFNTKAFFINERTFLPAFFYLALVSLFPEFQRLSPIMPAAVFLIIALMRIADSYRVTGVAYNFFDAALLISTGSLFYPGLIWFGILVFIGIAVFRTGSFIEIMSAVIGLIAPYFITAGVYYMTDADFNALGKQFTDNLFNEILVYQYSKPLVVALIFTGITLLAGLVFLLSRINTQKIRSRKIFYLLIWMFLLNSALFFILPSVSVEMIWLAAIPVSYILSHYFIYVKGKIVPELIFVLLILFVVLIQVSGWLPDH